MHILTYHDVLPAWTSWGIWSMGHPWTTRALQPWSPRVPPTRLSHAPRPSLGLQIVPSGRPSCSSAH